MKYLKCPNCGNFIPARIANGSPAFCARCAEEKTDRDGNIVRCQHLMREE